MPLQYVTERPLHPTVITCDVCGERMSHGNGLVCFLREGLEAGGLLSPVVGFSHTGALSAARLRSASSRRARRDSCTCSRGTLLGARSG
jgi:hypothetical protein